MQQEIIRWYRKNKRDLPWRSTNPWGVVVSEFMLQQTPVSRVLPIWKIWMDRWPNSGALAQAPRADVIRAWGTLGYPRRAIRLHETAKIIHSDFGGEIPRSIEELRTLPGIGDYTAAAIVAFAFEKKSLVLDTNIRRLFSRLLDGKEFPSLHQTSNERVDLENLIPKNAAIWAASTMELGALICTARNPKCDICPVAHRCSWKKSGYPRSTIVKKTQTWHGTNRQCRGRILRELRKNESITKVQLNTVWVDRNQLNSALESLIFDGLIQKKKNRYSLVD